MVTSTFLTFAAAHSHTHNRFFYKDGTLSEQRIELLNAVNFSWTAADAKLKRDNMGEGEKSRALGPPEEEEEQTNRPQKAVCMRVRQAGEQERKRLKSRLADSPQ